MFSGLPSSSTFGRKASKAGISTEIYNIGTDEEEYVTEVIKLTENLELEV
jgi:hypothetical protein